MEYSDESLYEMLEEIDELGIAVTDFEAAFMDTALRNVDGVKVRPFSAKQRQVILQMKDKYLA